MQTGRKAVESVKESAADTVASARAGMEKAKASTKEKMERMSTNDPVEKEAATLEKEARRTQAELSKEATYAYNEAARRMAESGGPRPGYKTWGDEGYTVRDSTGYTEGHAAATGGSEDYTTIGAAANITNRRHPEEPANHDDTPTV